jgi:hypothetical protein
MTGNTGDTGDTGDTGNTGNAGIQGEFGGGWFIEDRSDFPFVTEADPSGVPLEGQVRNLASFGERTWTARWWAFLVLHDFAVSGWRGAADPVMTAAWATVPGLTAGELVDLVNDHKNERAAAMGEILSQDVEFNTDFMAVLNITPSSHPNTYRIMHIASQVASYAALYYKGGKQRPRPSQLLPALLPPIPVPGHASWPSGHATQAWLKTLCLEFVLGGIAGMGTAMNGTPPNPVAPGTLNLGVISANLRTLALRIGRNREIAGLHYPSDSRHGRELADAILPSLTNMMATVPDTWFKKAVDAARLEWT